MSLDGHRCIGVTSGLRGVVDGARRIVFLVIYQVLRDRLSGPAVRRYYAVYRVVPACVCLREGQ